MELLIDCARRNLVCGGQIYDCRIGKDGYIDGAQGREGDGMTPLGVYALRFGLYRADRLPPPPGGLTFRALRPDDGWCDAAKDAAYNRYIRLPYAASHEKLWREDGAYDIILVLSHNDSPPRPGLGSAIFIHTAQIDDRQTEGCIALSPQAMAAILPSLYPGMPITITG